MAFFIEHRLGVSAPPQTVWEILSDIEGWDRWSGLYRQSSGTLRIGETLTMEMALAGEEPERLKATVVDWAPELQIHLSMKLYGGLLSTTRYFEIEKLTDTGCIFSNGEIYRGLLARFMPRRLKRALRQGFVQMSESLKVQAEAAWRRRSIAPISVP